MDVGVRDLKANLSRYLERAKHGEVVNVTDRGVLIARLVPAQAGDESVTRELASLVAQGRIRWSGKTFSPAPPEVKLQRSGPSLSDLVSEGRT